MLAAGYDVSFADTSGVGYEVIASFTPVPEPSSIVLFSYATLFLTLFVFYRRSHKCSA